MFYFYFILSLCVVASCNQDGELLKCKPKPGCSIARCDPRPAVQWFGNDGLHNDYPILCQQNEASPSATAVTELVNKFDEMRTDFVKLEGRLERSEKLEFDMNTEITLLEKKNAETESRFRDEMDRVKKEGKEGKTQLNGAMKQITYLEETNGEMRNEMDNVNKEAVENKGMLNWAMKEIASLEKNKVEMKGKVNRLEIEANGSKRKMNDAMIQIDLLKKKNEKLEKEESKVKTKDLIKLLCPVIYENKCFIAVIERRLNYDDGVAVCKSLGGHLANIYSQTHMDDVMKYIKENRMAGDGWQWFRLGMKYDPKAKKLILRDGTDAPAGLKWLLGGARTVEAYDRYADSTNLILNVDQSSIGRYFVNYLPSTSFYVLCEIE